MCNPMALLRLQERLRPSSFERIRHLQFSYAKYRPSDDELGPFRPFDSDGLDYDEDETWVRFWGIWGALQMKSLKVRVLYHSNFNDSDPKADDRWVRSMLSVKDWRERSCE